MKINGNIGLYLPKAMHFYAYGLKLQFCFLELTAILLASILMMYIQQC